MLDKKIKIIIAFAIIVVIAAIGIVYFSRNKQENTQKEKQPSSQAISLPFSEDVSVGNIDNKAEIQKIFSKYTTEAVKNDIQETRFKDEGGKIIPLKKFSASIGFNVNSSIESIIDRNNYSVFSCAGKNGRKSFGLIFFVRTFEKNENVDYKRLYEDAENRMKKWERTMLHDLHSILFPQIQFSGNQLDQNLAFKDGKYRYAEITLPDGTKSSLNYALLGDPIVISASVECMDKATENLFDE